MAPRNNGLMDRNEDADLRDEESGIENAENEIRRDLSSRAFNVNRYFIGKNSVSRIQFYTRYLVLN